MAEVILKNIKKIYPHQEPKAWPSTCLLEHGLLKVEA